MQTFFPSETVGTGSILPQYRKINDGQGGGLKLRRVSCKICGFPGADLVRHDHSGGSLDGNGAGGSISLQSNGSGTQQSGDGNQTYNKGAGCPMCFSRNFYGSGHSFNEMTASYPESGRLV